MNLKNLLKNSLLSGLIICSIAGCKKKDLEAERRSIEEQRKTPPYNALPDNRKEYAFLKKEFKLKSILKNNHDVTLSFTPKAQLDNTFYFYGTKDVCLSFGEENVKNIPFPKGEPRELYYPSRFKQYAHFEKKSDGKGYLTLVNYLLDSGEPGPITFEILKFEPKELILRRTENGAIIDRIFFVSEELKEKPDIYDSWSPINQSKTSN